jgi:hypothetical protein
MFGDGSTSISDIGDFDSKIGERLCQSPLEVQKRYRSGAFEEKDVRFKSKIKYSEPLMIRYSLPECPNDPRRG